MLQENRPVREVLPNSSQNKGPRADEKRKCQVSLADPGNLSSMPRNIFITKPRTSLLSNIPCSYPLLHNIKLVNKLDWGRRHPLQLQAKTRPTGAQTSSSVTTPTPSSSWGAGRHGWQVSNIKVEWRCPGRHGNRQAVRPRGCSRFLGVSAAKPRRGAVPFRERKAVGAQVPGDGQSRSKSCSDSLARPMLSSGRQQTTFSLPLLKGWTGMN